MKEGDIIIDYSGDLAVFERESGDITVVQPIHGIGVTMQLRGIIEHIRIFKDDDSFIRTKEELKNYKFI